MSLSISQEERQAYYQHFSAAGPVNGKLGGTAARGILMQSNLPTHQLGEIWELADLDKDGALDFNEYCIAIKLVYSLLNGSIQSIPKALPSTLIPNTTPTPTSPPTTTYNTTSGPIKWYIDSSERAKYQSLFSTYSRSSNNSTTVRLLDLDDFLGTLGIARTSIMQIWALVDVRKYQQLNEEQFVYLMHGISEHRKGAQIPPTIPPAVKDLIYKSLSLDTTAAATTTMGSGHSYSGNSSNNRRTGDAKNRPGLYGEKSGNVALADSYLSKLKSSATFRNEAGSRYASSHKHAEEERRLAGELEALDKELAKLRDNEKRDVGSDEGRLQGVTVRELEELKEFKKREREARTVNGRSTESVQEIKQGIFDLEGHLSFLLAEEKAVEEFLDSGRSELAELQLEQIRVRDN